MLPKRRQKMNPKLPFQNLKEGSCKGWQRIKAKSSFRAKGSASGAICGLTRRSAQGRFTRCNLAALNSRKGSTRERRKRSKKSTKSKLICSARSTRRKLPQKRKRHGRRRKLPGSQRQKKPHNNIYSMQSVWERICTYMFHISP